MFVYHKHHTLLFKCIIKDRLGPQQTKLMYHYLFRMNRDLTFEVRQGSRDRKEKKGREKKKNRRM